jgi:hypothetical protein
VQPRAWRSIVLGLALLLALAAALQPAAGAAQPRLQLLGQFSFPSGQVFQDTVVGGLSDLVYDPARQLYYAVSDDRSEQQPARFYSLQIELGPVGIADVRVVGVTTLDSDAGRPGVQPYARGELDAEGIALLGSDELIISSERDQQGRPWVRRFGLDGTLRGELPVPERFLPVSEPGPDGRPRAISGVRSNLGFEGLGLTADGRTLYLANEEALAQDGPIATLEAGTLVRILRYDRGAEWQPGAEVAYAVEKISRAPDPADAFADNGVSALLPVGHLWPDLDLLVLERSFATGVGNDVVLYGARLGGAQRTESLAALPRPFDGPLASKVRLARMSDLGIVPDNLEALALGPRLPNGRPSLIVMSDDNFSEFQPPQVNQFLLFELQGTLLETQPPPGGPAVGPTPPPAPVQVPAALPRTGTLGVGPPLAGLALAGLGLALRYFGRRRPTRR